MSRPDESASGAGMGLNRHPLAHLRRHHHWLVQKDLARLLRAQAQRRGRRSSIGRHRVWLWEATGTTPSEESQQLLAVALDVPAAMVEHLGWPDRLPVFEQPAPLSPSGSRSP